MPAPTMSAAQDTSPESALAGRRRQEHARDRINERVPDRVNELDLLRFLAALAVVLFHYAFRGHAADGLSAMPYPLLAPLASYGYLGVHLFFLISGFVILMTAANGSLRGFLVSRIVRLYPAFWICCTATFVALTLLGSGRPAPSLGQYLINLTMLSGFLGVPSVDGVYWSLFVELQFYALVAVLLALGRIRQAEAFLLVWLAAVLALDLLAGGRLGMVRALLIADYAPYFIGGALCFLIRQQGLTRQRLGALAVAWLLALHQAPLDVAEFAQHYRQPLDLAAIRLILSAFFAVMLLVALRRTGLIGRRPWLALGALTYPLYLLHQNIGYLVFNAIYPAVDAHLLLWGTLLLMLAATHWLNLRLERPLAAWLKRALNGALDLLPGRPSSQTR